ncbi:expressed unknown protein [Seminavis robusta]|uniref:t-SNARE coiled-coil homology domain-containing protein n=1 Tax=Seminavis robusta TaxID=568900 RepID=A0A9N8E983_9STRA|nr:expressed unknown protein [Seminavis robusta]|eukprot:Sro828_g208020.1 n/a (188) ;mRNA; r:39228-39924
MSSAFDEAALSKPLLGPAKTTRWSSGSLLSSSASSRFVGMFSCKDLSDDEDSMSDGSVSYYEEEDEEEEIVFDGETRLVLHEVTLEPVDIEAAIMTERHGAFTHLNQSMQQIFQISQDLSALVDDQGDQIESLQTNSMEAKDHAENGLKHLQHVNQQYDLQQQRRILCLYAILMLVGILWMFGASTD